jgi:hypothetical protein
MNERTYMTPEEKSSNPGGSQGSKNPNKTTSNINTNPNSTSTPEQEYSIEQLIHETKERGNKLIIQTGSEASPEDINFSITEILHTKKLAANAENITKVKACIAVLAQEGATSPKFAETRQCDLFNIPVTVKEIRQFAKICGSIFQKNCTYIT